MLCTGRDKIIFNSKGDCSPLKYSGLDSGLSTAVVASGILYSVICSASFSAEHDERKLIKLI